MATSTVSEEILAKLFGESENDERYELVDGNLEAKPMTSIFHSLAMIRLGRLLDEQVGDDYYVLADPISKIRETEWRRPDIAVLKAEDGEPWKYVMPGHWPQLCVEIVSVPDQTTEEMLEKCALYHAQGVPFCWVIEPESRTAWTYHAGASSVWVPTSGTLEAGPIRISPGEIWRGLKNKKGNRLK
jgi:Uma2 family endonuclease